MEAKPKITEAMVEEAYENRFDGYDQCEIVRELLSCEAQLALHRWIPVEERLPEETGDVLILCEGKILQVEATVGEGTWEYADGTEYQRTEVWCNDVVGFGSLLLGEDLCVSHWKPVILPKETTENKS